MQADRRVFVTLMACALLLLTAGCGLGSPAAASTHLPQQPHGWSWYQDKAFPFAVAVPPGWRLAAYTDSGVMGTNPNCAHVIDFFPPNEPVKQEDVPTSPELIRLFIRIQCPPWDPSQDTNAQPMPGTYMLGPAKSTMYQSDVVGGAVQRSDVATLGGHQYTFLLQYTYGPTTPESGSQQALTIYRHMVSSFTYQGAA